MKIKTYKHADGVSSLGKTVLLIGTPDVFYLENIANLARVTLVQAGTTLDAQEFLEKETPDCVVITRSNTNLLWVSVFVQDKTKEAKIPVLIVGGTKEEARQAGASAILPKSDISSSNIIYLVEAIQETLGIPESERIMAEFNPEEDKKLMLKMAKTRGIPNATKESLLWLASHADNVPKKPDSFLLEQELAGTRQR